MLNWLPYLISNKNLWDVISEREKKSEHLDTKFFCSLLDQSYCQREIISIIVCLLTFQFLQTFENDEKRSIIANNRTYFLIAFWKESCDVISKKKITPIDYLTFLLFNANKNLYFPHLKSIYCIEFIWSLKE